MNAPAVTPILWKFLSSIMVGGVVYLITEVSNPGDNQLWKITISVLATGTVMILQFIVKFERRLEAVEAGQQHSAASMENLVTKGFTQINEATALFGLVESSALRADAVTQLVRNATEISTDGPSLVYDFAQAQISTLATLLKELNSGEATFHGEDHEWLVSLTCCASQSMDATSTSVDQDLWPTEFGRRYLLAQRDAMQRGVRVRRLFIVARPEEIDDQLKQRCDRHRDLGIDVRVVAISALPPTAQLDPMNDFIVFDKEVSYEVSQDLGSQDAHPVIEWTRIVRRPDHVARRVHRFNDLWDAGQ